MEKSELVAYARERYGIEEQHKWEKFPSFSVLTHPQTGKWIALLVNKRGADGRLTDVCDLKCGQKSIAGRQEPWLGKPHRMPGSNWVGITFGPQTERETVQKLFDDAVRWRPAAPYTVTLESSEEAGEEHWHDTPVPAPAALGRGTEETAGMPSQIVALRQMIRDDAAQPEASPGSIMRRKAADFRRQAEFMQSYEDTVPWSGWFHATMPAYSDLSLKQLRGYFTWRSQARRGVYPSIPASAASIYVYELLNGIGASSPEDVLSQLDAFEQGFSSYSSAESLLEFLPVWKFDFCVVQNLPRETAQHYADPAKSARDRALAVLQDPAGAADGDVCEALLMFSEKARRESVVFQEDAEQAQSLFAAVWRRLRCAEYDGQDVFTACFGTQRKKLWCPLWGTLYSETDPASDRTYRLSASRTFSRENGIWYVTGYSRQHFDALLFRGLMHAVDLCLRKHLKIGRPLRWREQEKWAELYIAEAIQAYEAASRPEIVLQMQDLARIRQEAAVTRESLLTDEERGAASEDDAAPAPPAEAPVAPKADAGPLDAAQSEILRALLEGKPVESLLSQQHQMASVMADQINEALFDLIGDNAVEADGVGIVLIEDYREEVAQVIGGDSHGRQ